MKNFISVLAGLLWLAGNAFSQNQRITGQVKDDKGQVISFASVVETNNTKNGVTADASGIFAITITSNKITVSAAGFTPQIITVSGNTANITLVAAGPLQEVVVTSLGIRRTRNQVPYAAQQINGDEVSKNRGSNFITNLSGKVSGVDIKQTNTLGGSTNVVIRGYKSILFDNQALFVIDGVPFNNGNTTGINTNTANQRTGRGGFDYGSRLKPGVFCVYKFLYKNRSLRFFTERGDYFNDPELEGINKTLFTLCICHSTIFSTPV